MERLFLTGKNFNKKDSITSNLFLPISKQPVPLPSTEPERTIEETRRSHISDDKNSLNWIINEAVEEEIRPNHVKPSDRAITYDEFKTFAPKLDFLGKDFRSMPPIDRPGALNCILGKHPFPLSQGPLVFPINKIAAFEKQTLFTHADSDPQECMEWIPMLTGKLAWNPNSLHVHDLSEPINSVQGPASTKKMDILYTCDNLKCVVHCPCSVCNDDRDNCKLMCREEVCDGCNSQCLEHQIKLPRSFDSEKDLYTIVTNTLGCYKIGIPYAGIPAKCDQCSSDVLEHQTFHLAFHSRCRYCRNEFRPFERRNILKHKDYVEAEKLLKWADNRTCSFCLVKYKNKFEREIHEATVHENKGKYKCESCEKTYSDKNALAYHVSNKHGGKNEDEKPRCKLCPSKFTTEANLKRHLETVHSDTKFECEHCGDKFTRQDTLNSHLKEQHKNLNVNLDFVENIASFLLEKCDQCDKTFKRKYQLQRHVNKVHCDRELKKQFKCSKCELKYKTPDTLRRHMKEKHKE